MENENEVLNGQTVPEITEVAETPSEEAAKLVAEVTGKIIHAQNEVASATNPKTESTTQPNSPAADLSAKETAATSAANDEAASEAQPLPSDEDRFASERARAKWYALHTFTGYETMVEENLRLVAKKYNLEHRIFDIIIPMEDVIEEKRGKRKIVSRKVMPGYVLVKMLYGDDIWHNVTRTRGITGFVGPKGRPLPLGDDEVARLRLEKIKIDINIKAGDKVEIVDGPLISQIGDITAIDKATGKVKANVNMFGRVMAVDLELSQIRKI